MKIIFGSDRKHITQELDKIIAKNIQDQILIIDMKRNITPKVDASRVRYFRPNSQNELIDLILEIEDYITRRTRLLIVNGIIEFLRDYRGNSAKLNSQNNKTYAAIMSILSTLSRNYLLNIVISSIETGLIDKHVVFTRINQYYNIEEVQV
ncbi:MAG: hypothetical protein INQ03_07315 [Candidatus Heimdallarchaeota archaeon]|nr:hypothetical protein [Candidatus Heimdallarchaeota archaeon]